jgi:pilus assembly protein Flp/PilA
VQDGFMRRFVSTADVSRFLRAQEGATAIEYAMIASGIAAALVATITSLGGSVANMWTAVSGMFN